ncbi:hypothetical protein ANO14919_043570 [Xylariales sp. No.14919]|nr:hypothetical protein ANO14919_043570 [Xylariales sp. No.14919]
MHLDALSTGITADFTIYRQFAYKWDRSISGEHYTSPGAAYLWVSIPNILTDLAILALPASTLYHLQTTRTRKTDIFVKFLTGVF